MSKKKTDVIERAAERIDRALDDTSEKIAAMARAGEPSTAEALVPVSAVELAAQVDYLDDAPAAVEIPALLEQPPPVPAPAPVASPPVQPRPLAKVLPMPTRQPKVEPKSESAVKTLLGLLAPGLVSSREPAAPEPAPAEAQHAGYLAALDDLAELAPATPAWITPTTVALVGGVAAVARLYLDATARDEAAAAAAAQARAEEEAARGAEEKRLAAARHAAMIAKQERLELQVRILGGRVEKSNERVADLAVAQTQQGAANTQMHAALLESSTVDRRISHERMAELQVDAREDRRVFHERDLALRAEAEGARQRAVLARDVDLDEAAAALPSHDAADDAVAAAAGDTAASLRALLMGG